MCGITCPSPNFATLPRKAHHTHDSAIPTAKQLCGSEIAIDILKPDESFVYIGGRVSIS
jgi:hypothetical protein